MTEILSTRCVLTTSCTRDPCSHHDYTRPSPLFMSCHSTSCQLATYNFLHVRKSPTPIFPSGSRFFFSQTTFSPQPVQAPPAQKKAFDLICVSIFISLTKYTCSFSKFFLMHLRGISISGKPVHLPAMKAMFVILLFGRCCEHNCEGGKFTVREDNSGGEKIKGRNSLREKIIREGGVRGGSYCMRNAVG